MYLTQKGDEVNATDIKKSSADKVKIRIYGEISHRHEADFLLIKGVLGCKNNGEVLQQMIDRLAPQLRHQAALKRAERG